MAQTITSKDVATIFDYLSRNPAPTDKDVIAMAESAGMNIEKFRETIYLTLGTFVGGGRSRDKELTPDQANVEQLAMGIDVEHEHVIKGTAASDLIAEKISLDHLSELPESYYTLLAKMENLGEKEKPKFSKLAKKLIGA